MKKRIVIFTCLLSLISFLTIAAQKHFELSRFIDPETCGGCHDEIYEQWKGSMHQLSHIDPVYKAAALHDLKGLTNKDEIAEAESCVKCHTPLGFITGYPNKTSNEYINPPEITKQGIQCDYCHSATGAYKVYNASLTFKPGNGDENPGVKRGPFKDSKSDYHKVAYSEFHTRSEICGSCHDVRHVVYGTKLETTYEEWQAGPYNSKDPKKYVPCQGCHMYQRPGIPATGSTARLKNPGTAAADGPLRKHIFTHYFAGGNVMIPRLYKNKVHAKLAEERLTHAAKVKIDASGIKSGVLRVGVTNTGAGHKLPTGLTNVRQMWLEIKVYNSSKRVVYSSGTRNRRGYLSKNSVIFNTIFGNGKGKRVENIAKAKEILKDHRIKPLETVVETYKIPKMKKGYYRIKVRLYYRSAPQRLLDSLAGRGKIKAPAVLMASDDKTGYL